ncbi:MAG: ribosome biogenesis GTPase Der [Bdellovibrio sp. CG10_big_fil_rev_8_21_14_0_10_47_8]|nr:MAG: ribosome biogenesis GTPase Der [Bdellovibrio sp. CG10_big_fil_rev_8_21_14_0_10_47_8]
MLSKVAIVGRPNVGKSTLFNILTGSRKSVVKNQAGVTRDIIIEPCEVWGKHFDLIDTGGITEAHDTFSQLIREQVTEFLQTVDFLLVVMDGRSGLIPEDREIIKIAIHTGKPFLLIVNKVDKLHEEDVAKAEFYEFGEDVLATSFEQRRGVSEILEWIHARLPEQIEKVREGATIAIVGKPNVGKSSMINALLGQKRMLVSDIAGTTIDSVDTPFLYNGQKYILVDTAGLRKSAKRDDHLEIISAFKSQESIRRADIVLLMIDGTMGPTDQDARIMQAILEDHKGVIVVSNKSDLGREQVPEYRRTLKEQVEKVFHFFVDVPIVYTSAKTEQGVDGLLEKIEWMSQKLAMRISTADLNDFFFDVIRKAPAPVWGISNVKFYYLTQTNQQPPAFIAFANHPDGVDNSYRRFLIKNLKEKFDLVGIPLRIFVMKSRRGGKGR